jgi:hypothetical protein
MTPPLSVTIIYNKANTYGLNDDVTVIERILKKLQDSIGHPIGKAKTVDMREPLTHSDIQIHLEIPIFSAIPWGHTNVILVNPEQWSFAYDAYAHAFDALLFRDEVSANKFREDFSKKGISTDNIFVVPWCASWQVSDIKGGYGKNGDLGFVCFVAGSASKCEYLKKLLPYWTENDPALTIYTVRNDFAEDLKKAAIGTKNVTIKCQDLDSESRYRIMTLYRGHLVCSSGEAFGYAAANAEVCGAFTIMNSLPTFKNSYSDSTGISWISNSYLDSTLVRYSTASPTTNIRNELESAFELFKTANFEEIRKTRQELAFNRFSSTCTSFLTMLRQLHTLVKERKPVKGNFYCPPVLHQSDCPPITIITPTYNRKRLFDIAFHNILQTDYPHDKIEWVVIEDNEKTPHMVGERIMSFQVQVPQIKIKYIPIEGRMSIGEKRNIGIENASNDIILFMDDDDHYPETSFRRRVAWLTKGTKRGKSGQANIACCTSIALYDLKRGTSAVNVPPYDIPLAQRVSEATLTFRKSAWVERKFPDVSIAEGESWISGREDSVIEIPPQQIIVAFSHGGNQSSRRIPPSDSKPACFWGFPKEYLIFIHDLVGVQVEDDTKSKKNSKLNSSK